MLVVIKAIIIAIVEGITEFIPVSSTGHMIIVGELIGFEASAGKVFTDMFEVVIQLGAILAIVVLYWKKIIDSFKHFQEYGLKLWMGVVIGSIPMGVLGITLNHKIKEYLFNSFTVAIGLIIGAFLLLYFEKTYRRKAKTKNMEDITFIQSIKVGLFQCLALWPGMSRSSSTIIGGWYSGLNNTAAAEFSFFLALPAMFGASGLELIKADFSAFNNAQIIALVVGFLVAFLVALLVVDRFVSFLKKKPMRIFAFYRLLIGIILLILCFTHVL